MTQLEILEKEVYDCRGRLSYANRQMWVTERLEADLIEAENNLNNYLTKN